MVFRHRDTFTLSDTYFGNISHYISNLPYSNKQHHILE